MLTKCKQYLLYPCTIALEFCMNFLKEDTRQLWSPAFSCRTDAVIRAPNSVSIYSQASFEAQKQSRGYEPIFNRRQCAGRRTVALKRETGNFQSSLWLLSSSGLFYSETGIHCCRNVIFSVLYRFFISSIFKTANRKRSYPIRVFYFILVFNSPTVLTDWFLLKAGKLGFDPLPPSIVRNDTWRFSVIDGQHACVEKSVNNYDTISLIEIFLNVNLQ